MRFEPTKLEGAWLVHLEPVFDSRGFFVRTFSIEEFITYGLETNFPQHSASFSMRKGTLRGMHFQRNPHGEVKLVRCVKGAIWDVIIDIRPTSQTYREWQAFELSDRNNNQLYIPKGFAHGFQTLTDEVEVSYLISEPHVPEAADGLRYNDPSFDIAWPSPITVISDKDLRWPNFAERLGLFVTN
jgi:dTDP-4-dehydrorhamnose 3,5-epimerase